MTNEEIFEVTVAGHFDIKTLFQYGDVPNENAIFKTTEQAMESITVSILSSEGL